MFAVCQEVPQFDGPNYAIRLERPDGSLFRGLYEIGDGDPCSEIAWAPDGKTLGVLSAHVARIRFVDVRWALNNPTIETTHHSWRAVDAPGISGVVLAKHLRFTSRSTVEFQLCSGTPESVPGNNVAPCTPPHAMEIPQPIFNAAAHRTAGM